AISSSPRARRRISRSRGSPRRRPTRLSPRRRAASETYQKWAPWILSRPGTERMHLSPKDIDKLLLHSAGFLAQKRLARGLRLNYPEAVALLATQLLELVRDGRHGVADLMDVGRRILGR